MLTLADFDFVRNLVREQSAIVLDDQKHYLVESRLAGFLQKEGFRSAADLVARLRSQPSGPLHDRVVELMTTNETTFFRDVHPFETLRDEVLPGLIRARAGERRLRIWSAACSTGQEPYSLAMLLLENFVEAMSWDVTVFATDLSNEVLRKARQGRYSQLEVNRGLPARLLVKYFRKEGDDWQVGDGVRRLIQFRQLNLAEPWLGLGKFDVVLLRNVLIYFDVETKREILKKIKQILRPDGALFLGCAETTLTIDAAFERVPAGRSGCYRLRG